MFSETNQMIYTDDVLSEPVGKMLCNIEQFFMAVYLLSGNGLIRIMPSAKNEFRN